MAQLSLIWDSGGAGDASPHSEAVTAKLFAAVLGASGANKGPIPGMLNELNPTISGTNILMNTGYAIVDGHPYYNDASLSTAITTPSVGTTGRRLVLRCDWAAQTVRALIISSADGTATIPAMTQTSGTTYDVPICAFTTTTGGVSTITLDERDWAGNWRNVQIKRRTASGSHAGTTMLPIAATVGNLDIDAKVGEVWDVEAVFTFTCGSSGGLKAEFQVPAGATIRNYAYIFPARIVADGAVQVIISEIASTFSRLSGSVSGGGAVNVIPLTGTVHMKATIDMGATPGKITAYAAQDTATSTLTIDSGTIRGVRA